MSHYYRRLIQVGISQDGLALWCDASKAASYPGSGTTWTDITGGNNGTLINGVGYSSSDGGVLTFDGSNDYVDFGTFGNYTSGDFSFMLWIKFNSVATNQTIFYKGSLNINGYYFQMRTATKDLVFYTSQTGSQQYSLTASNEVAANSWYNITIVRSGASVKIYKNGVDRTATSGTHINPTSTFNNLQLGRHQTAGQVVNGSIGEFENWNRALTATEVLNNFNATKSRYGL